MNLLNTNQQSPKSGDSLDKTGMGISPDPLVVEAASRQKQTHGGSESLTLQIGREVLLNNSINKLL